MSQKAGRRLRPVYLELALATFPFLSNRSFFMAIQALLPFLISALPPFSFRRASAMSTSVHALDHAGDVPCAALATRAAHCQHQVQLDVLGLRVVFEQTGAEAGFDGGLRDHGALLVVLGVELADGAAAPTEERHTGRWRTVTGGPWARLSLLSALQSHWMAEMLMAASNEPARKRHALADVGEHQVALDVALQRNVQHRRRHVHADPGVRPAVRGLHGGQDLARQAAAAADVEDQRRALEVQQLEGAAGHGRLNVLDARRRGVLARLGVVVVDVGGAAMGARVRMCWDAGCGGGGAYRLSSGRDMLAGYVRSRTDCKLLRQIRLMGALLGLQWPRAGV